MAISALSSPMHQVLPNQKIAAQWRSYSGLRALKVMVEKVLGSGQLGVTDGVGLKSKASLIRVYRAGKMIWSLQPLQADMVS